MGNEVIIVAQQPRILMRNSLDKELSLGVVGAMHNSLPTNPVSYPIDKVSLRNQQSEISLSNLPFHR